MFRHVPWKRKPTNRNYSGRTSPNISKPFMLIILQHWTTLATSPPCTVGCTTVHPQRPSSAPPAIVASCHHSHHHGDSAQWLPGSRWGSSWHPNGWNLMNPREVFEKIRHQMMMLVCLHVVAMKNRSGWLFFFILPKLIYPPVNYNIIMENHHL